MPAYCLSRITAEALTPQRRMIWEKIKPCNTSAVISAYTLPWEFVTCVTFVTNFQLSLKNLSNSFLSPFSVACRPIFTATCLHDIFSKILVTDWESLTEYHTGDLVTRWSSDASNISSGILNWVPNLIIYTFRFISALAVVLYYDPTFALFALLGIPFSALMSRPLLRRMRNNNQKSAAMNAKMYGFNQEAFSNIQTIKAFDLIHFYTDRLKTLQKDYISMRLEFQRMSILTSVLMSIVGFIVSYSPMLSVGF